MAIVEAEVTAEIEPGMRITEDELMRLPKDGPGNPTGFSCRVGDIFN